MESTARGSLHLRLPLISTSPVQFGAKLDNFNIGRGEGLSGTQAEREREGREDEARGKRAGRVRAGEGASIGKRCEKGAARRPPGPAATRPGGRFLEREPSKVVEDLRCCMPSGEAAWGSAPQVNSWGPGGTPLEHPCIYG